jgi:hypothetical protein
MKPLATVIIVPKRFLKGTKGKRNINTKNFKDIYRHAISRKTAFEEQME